MACGFCGQRAQVPVQEGSSELSLRPADWDGAAKLRRTAGTAMPKHYFHLTNGQDLVIDRHGARTRGRADIWLHARKVSDDAMAGLPAYPAWSDWLVCVHDANGRQVTVIPVLGPEGVPAAPSRVFRDATPRRWETCAACLATSSVSRANSDAAPLTPLPC